MASASAARPALSGTQRLFFALWPDAAACNAIADAAHRMHRQLGGRRTRDDSIHLTLAFLGDVDVERLPPLLALPSSVPTPAFTLVLDEWECWTRNRIGWLGPSDAPGSLRNLVSNLEAWLGAGGFALERRGFVPHVTLVRDAQCAPLAAFGPAIAWEVREFVLVRSDPSAHGRRYEAIGRWRLTQGR